jgi:hypothetical protein
MTQMQQTFLNYSWELDFFNWSQYSGLLADTKGEANGFGRKLEAVAKLLARRDPVPAIFNTSNAATMYSTGAINPANMANASGCTNLAFQVARPSTAREIRSGTNKNTQSKSVSPVLALNCRVALSLMLSPFIFLLPRSLPSGSACGRTSRSGGPSHTWI